MNNVMTRILKCIDDQNNYGQRDRHKMYLNDQDCVIIRCEKEILCFLSISLKY